MGLGWGNSNLSGWLFLTEIGVLLSAALELDGRASQVNNPGAIFDANGNNSEAVVFPNEIAIDVNNLEDDISDFKYYPDIALGISYRF